ncbi:hypothetical protein EK21DRAFT_118075 [Setomelanomma holmii]|uniref:Uncharacterized protein n=1 Tax=Setomelanomma holmii TaxID=210430 RepID=A0A9P4GWU0_9PLEO|nr:hypothetical protein EK21DRAFT_118075 [Setomelanomma holmii]
MRYQFCSKGLPSSTTDSLGHTLAGKVMEYPEGATATLDTEKDQTAVECLVKQANFITAAPGAAEYKTSVANIKKQSRTSIAASDADEHKTAVEDPIRDPETVTTTVCDDNKPKSLLEAWRSLQQQHRSLARRNLRKSSKTQLDYWVALFAQLFPTMSTEERAARILALKSFNPDQDDAAWAAKWRSFETVQKHPEAQIEKSYWTLIFLIVTVKWKEYMPDSVGALKGSQVASKDTLQSRHFGSQNKTDFPGFQSDEQRALSLDAFQNPNKNIHTSKPSAVQLPKALFEAYTKTLSAQKPTPPLTANRTSVLHGAFADSPTTTPFFTPHHPDGTARVIAQPKGRKYTPGGTRINGPIAADDKPSVFNQSTLKQLAESILLGPKNPQLAKDASIAFAIYGDAPFTFTANDISIADETARFGVSQDDAAEVLPTPQLAINNELSNHAVNGPKDTLEVFSAVEQGEVPARDYAHKGCAPSEDAVSITASDAGTNDADTEIVLGSAAHSQTSTFARKGKEAFAPEDLLATSSELSPHSVDAQAVSNDTEVDEAYTVGKYLFDNIDHVCRDTVPDIPRRQELVVAFIMIYSHYGYHSTRPCPSSWKRELDGMEYHEAKKAFNEELVQVVVANGSRTEAVRTMPALMTELKQLKCKTVDDADAISIALDNAASYIASALEAHQEALPLQNSTEYTGNEQSTDVRQAKVVEEVAAIRPSTDAEYPTSLPAPELPQSNLPSANSRTETVCIDSAVHRESFNAENCHDIVTFSEGHADTTESPIHDEMADNHHIISDSAFEISKHDAVCAKSGEQQPSGAEDYVLLPMIPSANDSLSSVVADDTHAMGDISGVFKDSTCDILEHFSAWVYVDEEATSVPEDDVLSSTERCAGEELASEIAGYIKPWEDLSAREFFEIYTERLNTSISSDSGHDSVSDELSSSNNTRATSLDLETDADNDQFVVYDWLDGEVSVQHHCFFSEDLDDEGACNRVQAVNAIVDEVPSTALSSSPPFGPTGVLTFDFEDEVASSTMKEATSKGQIVVTTQSDAGSLRERDEVSPTSLPDDDTLYSHDSRSSMPVDGKLETVTSLDLCHNTAAPLPTSMLSLSTINTVETLPTASKADATQECEDCIALNDREVNEIERQSTNDHASLAKAVRASTTGGKDDIRITIFSHNKIGLLKDIQADPRADQEHQKVYLSSQNDATSDQDDDPEDIQALMSIAIELFDALDHSHSLEHDADLQDCPYKLQLPVLQHDDWLSFAKDTMGIKLDTAKTLQLPRSRDTDMPILEARDEETQPNAYAELFADDIWTGKAFDATPYPEKSWSVSSSVMVVLFIMFLDHFFFKHSLPFVVLTLAAIYLRELAKPDYRPSIQAVNEYSDHDEIANGVGVAGDATVSHTDKDVKLHASSFAVPNSDAMSTAFDVEQSGVLELASTSQTVQPEFDSRITAPTKTMGFSNPDTHTLHGQQQSSAHFSSPTPSLADQCMPASER